MWVKFLEDYSYIPPDQRNVSVGYKAGGIYNVTRTCREQVLRLGVAEDASNPRHEGEGDGDSGTSEDGDSTLQEEAASATERASDTGGESGGDEREGDAGGGEA